MLPAVVWKKLNNKVRPISRERREAIQIITAAILATCKTPSKKQLCEVAWKMVLEYAKSFKDVIEGQVIKDLISFNSLRKLLQCRVNNYKKNEMLQCTIK